MGVEPRMAVTPTVLPCTLSWGFCGVRKDWRGSALATSGSVFGNTTGFLAMLTSFAMCCVASPLITGVGHYKC